MAAGWEPWGTRPEDTPFEIPGQGLGIFSSRKAAWLGFNPLFRGFGGEELYIHRKYTLAGRKNLCLPALAWYHRFGNPGGVKYDLSRYNKVRNYVLGHQETGLDIAPIKQHFVDTGLLPKKEWEHLIKDPEANDKAPACKTCNRGGQNTAINANELPTKEHQRFVELIGKHKRVAIVAKRNWWNDLAAEAGATEVEFFPIEEELPAMEETDLLIIHSTHHGDRLRRELEARPPKPAAAFCCDRPRPSRRSPKARPAPACCPRCRPTCGSTRVARHRTLDRQSGDTVISLRAEDRQDLPGMVTMAGNLAKALAAHVANGLENISHEGMEARLNVCSLCDQRERTARAVCGCFLAAKAAMAVSECPIGRWPETPMAQSP